MQPINIAISCLMLFFNAQLLNAYPVFSEAWTNDDMDVLKVLLQRLGESVSEPRESTPDQTEKFEKVYFEDKPSSMKESSEESQDKMLRAELKQFLSAKDLKAVRSDSPAKRYSGCFGRRMDRIGSMTTLGCNTVGRYSKSFEMYDNEEGRTGQAIEEEMKSYTVDTSDCCVITSLMFKTYLFICIYSKIFI
ncbi:hypothetical protein JZ751_014924 [Albula glossodonta]|uniref:Brain natriuretic peptide n=1 Tax=Albula glossodonta TaxID=121402 RepID=A0A8T2MXH1_9TELE|nr:hypothetical protein JZ751_014924 [Albula glossodonta]